MTPCFRALAKIAGSTGYQLILIVETSGEPRQVHQNVARPRRPKLPPPAGQGMFSNVTASFWPHPRQDFGTVGQPATDQTVRPKFERYGRTAMSLAGWALPGRKKVMNPVDPGAIVPQVPYMTAMEMEMCIHDWCRLWGSAWPGVPCSYMALDPC